MPKNIFLRKDKYWIDFSIKGNRIRKPVGSLEEAEKTLAQLKDLKKFKNIENIFNDAINPLNVSEPLSNIEEEKTVTKDPQDFSCEGAD